MVYFIHQEGDLLLLIYGSNLSHLSTREGGEALCARCRDALNFSFCAFASLDTPNANFKKLHTYDHQNDITTHDTRKIRA